MTIEIRPLEADDVLGYEVRIAALPALVWRFWTEPDRLVRWMGDVAILEPQPGGAFRLRVQERRRRRRHSGLPAASRDGHDEGWRYFLGRLVEAAAGAYCPSGAP